MTFPAVLIPLAFMFGLGFLACWMMPVKQSNEMLNSSDEDYW